MNYSNRTRLIFEGKVSFHVSRYVTFGMAPKVEFSMAFVFEISIGTAGPKGVEVSCHVVLRHAIIVKSTPPSADCTWCIVPRYHVAPAQIRPSSRPNQTSLRGITSKPSSHAPQQPGG